MWWIGWSDAAFQDGTFELTLLVDGLELARAQIPIGGRVPTGPAFSNLFLSEEATSGGGPEEPGVLFPAGAKQIMAFFDFENMANGQAWRRSWILG
jgi:hypothetical protein